MRRISSMPDELLATRESLCLRSYLISYEIDFEITQSVFTSIQLFRYFSETCKTLRLGTKKLSALKAEVKYRNCVWTRVPKGHPRASGDKPIERTMPTYVRRFDWMLLTGLAGIIEKWKEKVRWENERERRFKSVNSKQIASASIQKFFCGRVIKFYCYLQRYPSYWRHLFPSAALPTVSKTPHKQLPRSYTYCVRVRKWHLIFHCFGAF
jgi:hypothetical protein